MKYAIYAARRRAVLGLASLAAATSGCGSDTADSTEPVGQSPAPAPCTLEGYIPIVVDVADATTAQPVTGATGTAVHTDGTSIPLEAWPQQPGRLGGGILGKSGYWTVTVRAAGYRDWSIDGVGTPFTTADDPCPTTHHLNANLVRSS